MKIPAITCVLLSCAAALAAPSTTSWYVACDGSDQASGDTLHPLATLEKARDLIRQARRSGNLPAGPLEVRIRAGVYRRSATFTLRAEDSGTPDSPVIYRAETPGTVRISGGRSIQGFQPVTDPGILARLPEEARGHVQQIDLKAAGISDYGPWAPHGFGLSPQAPLELFANDQPMTLARWPNTGFAHLDAVIQSGETPGKPGIFTFQSPRLDRWTQARDLMLLGYWKYYWADATLGVDHVDPATRQIHLAHSGKTNAALAAGMPFVAQNLLEEIDQPGEWSLDRRAGVLYFYPPESIQWSSVSVSMLTVPLVELEKVSQVIFDGLIFEQARFNGLVIRAGDHVTLRNSTLRNFGGTALEIQGGNHHRVEDSRLVGLGRGGIHMSGGDRKTLIPAAHCMERCDISNFGRLDRTYTPAVWLDGVGSRVARNRLHDGPSSAIRLSGNDHCIEFNEVYRVVQESDDQGGLDIWGNPGFRGNQLRYNFWHDIVAGPLGQCGQAGVRLDDAVSGMLIEGNIFYRCSDGRFGGVQIHAGKDNQVLNNLFIECKRGVSIHRWKDERWSQFIAPYITPEDVSTSPLYRQRYPALAEVSRNVDTNQIQHNWLINCGSLANFPLGEREKPNTLQSQAGSFADAPAVIAWYKAQREVPAGFKPLPIAEIEAVCAH